MNENEAFDAAVIETGAGVGDTVSVTFHGIAVGGSIVGKVTGPEGDGRIGMTAFVPFASPGGSADVKVTAAHKRHLEGELAAGMVPLAVPPCRHFTVCGGCDLQHLPYELQLSAKKSMIEGALKSGGLGDIPVADFVYGPEYAWRRRVALHVDAAGGIGYRPRKSHSILTPKDCPISVEPIEAFLKKGFRFDAVLPHGGTLYLEVGDDGRLYAMLRTGMLDKEGMHKCAEALDARVAGGVVEVAKNSEIRFGDADLHPTLGSFSQANGFVNARLVEAVCAGAGAAHTALDLYAGAGNFALPLAEAGLGVTAVESDVALIAAGRAASEAKGLAARVQFVQQRVEKYLSGTPAPVEYLVADPPRGGLGAISGRLGFAPRLALISCDLAVAARDLRALKEQGWTVDGVQPFDLFPQTAHVELLTLLHRKSVA